MTATTPSIAHSIEAASRDVVLGDVPKDTADGALEHVAAKATGVVATVDGRLHCVGDGVDHGIHGRNGMGHLLPLRNGDSGKVYDEHPFPNSLSWLEQSA
jgi:hypothetical protein